ncbi:hypothetical protein EX30DRAFT_71732 [Ascodesmis nigricans]|uniref:Transmembrane protein n=1 Tax=Ascodesmis nigricans TaxID=341454 RepID=A0A4S2MTQ5_9PEZI|nr:hypothetical protein EX30DRAFT_71732 [Ascodesmis nigricans]
MRYYFLSHSFHGAFLGGCIYIVPLSFFFFLTGCCFCLTDRPMLLCVDWVVSVASTVLGFYAPCFISVMPITRRSTSPLPFSSFLFFFLVMIFFLMAFVDDLWVGHTDVHVFLFVPGLVCRMAVWCSWFGVGCIEMLFLDALLVIMSIQAHFLWECNALSPV